jgi:diadenylate cyclase
MIELFSIGFVKVTLIDTIDICIVAYFLAKMYSLLKGTIGSQIFIGLIVVLVLSFLANLANLRAVSYLLRFITDIWVIAFIIVFQPEIRRLLVILARNPLFRWGSRTSSTDFINHIVQAAFELSQHQHGALIIVIKSSGIRGFSETGVLLNAELTKDLLCSIFYPRSALHDGAVIINKGMLEAARCTLPLSANTTADGYALGMRHRAGLGISEQADVLSVIVSEETGSVSVAEDGILYRGLSRDSLRKHLEKIAPLSPLKRLRLKVEQFFKKDEQIDKT